MSCTLCMLTVDANVAKSVARLALHGGTFGRSTHHTHTNIQCFGSPSLYIIVAVFLLLVGQFKSKKAD